ncbi:MAG: DinB family protein [Anaerosomatales bacterium]|nr:DinB family protein [Anaerosomatales bacterium]
MTRDELLEALERHRSEWEALLSRISEADLERPLPGHAHSVKDVIGHVTAYERWVVQRLREAMAGSTTDLPIDRVGYHRYNATIWREVAPRDWVGVLADSHRAYDELVRTIRALDDADLVGETDLVRALDPRWLEGVSLGEAIAADSYRHYAQHRHLLEEAAAQSARS